MKFYGKLTRRTFPQQLPDIQYYVNIDDVKQNGLTEPILREK